MFIDQHLGLDWLGYMDWVNKHPPLGKLFLLLYTSMGMQFACVPGMLVISGQSCRMYKLTLATIIAVIVCISLAALFPAASAYSYLGLRAADYPHLFMQGGYVHMVDFLGMRESTLRVIDMQDLRGVITFPSFHASCALLLIWGWWGIPWLRIPAIILNSAMLFSIPVVGGHYFIDMVAGAIIAVFAILAVKYMRGPQVPSVVSLPGKSTWVPSND